MDDRSRSGDTTAFLNGRIHTMDPASSVASGLVARSGSIVSVGDSRTLSSELPDDAEVIDLQGRVVLPGFVDGHCHFEMTVTHLAYAVHCHAPPHRSLAEICLVMGERARTVPRGEWVLGRADFNLEQWVEERRPLLRSDLDEAVPEHPAVVFSGMHVCTMNTLALRMSGLDSPGRVPRGASVDPETGRATELWDFLPLPRYGVEATADAMKERGRSLFQARGVTTIADIPFTPDGLDAYRLLHRSGELPARFGLWFQLPRLAPVDSLDELGADGPSDEWLHVGGVKLFVDGAGVDAAGDPSLDLKWTQDELDEAVWRAHDAGLQVWMHVAPSHTAADMALTALDRALARRPQRDHRHRVEHLGDMAPDLELLDRARRLGVIPVTTPQFVYSYADVDPEGSCSPLGTLHRMGFRVPGNSDCTGTQPESANPFHGIWCAVARRTRSGTVLRPEDRVELSAAIRMFTADAAFGCRMDDRGTLEPGKLADLVVLGGDPWEMPVDELPETPVDMTVIGGRVVWGRA